MKPIIDLILNLIKMFTGNKQVTTPQATTPKQYPALYPNTLRHVLQTGVNNPEWVSKKVDGKIVETYCNYFVRSICQIYGWHGFDDKMANDIYNSLKADTEHWEQTTNHSIATSYATKGALVIAAQLNPTGHGHVVVIAPEPNGVYSNKWGKVVAYCANVGGDPNFYGKGLNYAFHSEPEMFVYRG